MGYTENCEASPVGVNMIPRIRKLDLMPDYKLKILFDDGKMVLYDVNDDINSIEEFQNLKNQTGLWNCVQIDESRTCIYWNDRIDLPSDTLYEYGVPV